eukprot:14957568-Alexandrium_andersonii.AAC.1
MGLVGLSPGLLGIMSSIPTTIVVAIASSAQCLSSELSQAHSRAILLGLHMGLLVSSGSFQGSFAFALLICTRQHYRHIA